MLIEVKRAGVCGTDLHIWHGSYALARYPLTPGHEFSGVVAAVGDRVRDFEVGDRVTADPNLPCYACVFCQRRGFNQCLNLDVVGVTRAGAFAQYVRVPQSAVYSIGDLSFADAALLEPLACVVWGLPAGANPGGRPDAHLRGRADGYPHDAGCQTRWSVLCGDGG